MLRRYRKGIIVLFLMVFLQEIVAPTTALALTGGPSQPEVQSFEPVGTNQMVDLSTGDFNYNIPLMVVPGPNGGYPINLAYHAGIGMEQEASWVGLGWNINPGAITRNLRGVPDDFNGDEIKKTVSLKKDVTVGVGMDLASFQTGVYQEFFGQVLTGTAIPGKMEVYYNNYRGVGWSVSGVSLQTIEEIANVGKKASETFLGNLSFNFDSQTGLGMQVPIGIGNYLTKEDGRWSGEGSYSIGIGIHSRQGLQSVTFQKNKGHKKVNPNYNGWGGVSFVNHTYVPAQNNSMQGTNLSLSISLAKKTTIPGHNLKTKVSASVILNDLKSNEKDMGAYGTLYLDEQSNLDGAGTDYGRIMDMNVYNDVPISKNAVNMGLPIMTADVFTITGQGVGGSFRAHRNDVGKFYKTGNVSENNHITAGGELSFSLVPPVPAPLSLFHIGVDAGYGYHKSYSGKWTDGNENLDGLKFKSEDTNYPLYEPFYFKVAGEQVAIRQNEWDYMENETPVAFDLGLKWEGTSPKPIVKSNISGSTKQISAKNKGSERIKRVQNIGYSTKDEIVYDENYGTRSKHIYTDGEIPNSSNGAVINYSAKGKGHHLQEYNILRPDGTTYTYGLPAYNNVQKEKVFSNIQPTIPDYGDQYEVPYDALDASIQNDEGMNNYFSSTEIPEYVHSNLITEIKSADYVDLTNDGLSEDDFGFYAKFNYQEVSDYKWRAPYSDANYIKGYYSNELDDMASYVYGEKDLYYVHSIETKTHIAIFELGNRNDGKGVTEENQTANSPKGKSQKYLKKITLYSKKDLKENGIANATPLQTTHFEYNYELCQGIPNNDGGIDDPNHFTTAVNDGGKLTLKKVYITYNGNDKGRLSPYEFDYAASKNKDFSKINFDRWGNYQEYPTTDDQAINPYTKQNLSELQRNDNASAWCMTTIGLPSGGEINVDYEADDYGYVQDKRAMQMAEVYGFSKTDTEVLPTTDDKYKLRKNNQRLWFKLNEPLVGNPIEKEAQVKDYVEGIDEIYFKVYEELKFKFASGEKAKDYVEGYAKIDNSSFGYDSGNDDYAYVDLETVTYQTMGADVLGTHPFRKAGWQYVRYQRPDLFHNQNGADDFSDNVVNNLVAIPASLGTAISDALSGLGYYNKAAILGYCKKMNYHKASFVRLNSPNKKKYGGGHRTKSVTLSDNWVEGSRTFGTTYKYENKNGTTSGVADYEPLVGGEENALKNPIWYNGNDQTMSFKHTDAYLETPIAEAVYPGARVVYGRVVQSNLEQGGANAVTDAQSGINVNEYYTTKDFPVGYEQTGLKTKGYNLAFWIPGSGMQSVQNNGYSQGYTVYTNDMSGKPKAVSVYPYNENGIQNGELPISKIEYLYKTDNTGRLDNTVSVLDAHGSVRNATMGVEQDFVINEEQNHNFNIQTRIDPNIDAVFPPSGLFIPIPFPSMSGGVNYSESMYRGISTSKVIYKTGILDAVKVYSDGSTVVTKNVLYDAETGEALLTEVNNEWDKPVYNYSYPAHWNYEGMEPAYKNYRANVKIDGTAGNLKLKFNQGLVNFDFIPSTILTLGDEITIFENQLYKTYYVSNIDDLNSTFSLENSNGVSQAFANVNGFITRSGKRNLQSVKSGSVVSLSTDFLGNSNSNLAVQFELWNSVITENTSPVSGDTYFDLATQSQQPLQEWDKWNCYLPNYYNCAAAEPTFGTIAVKVADYDFNKIEFLLNGCKGSLNFINNSGDDTPLEMGYLINPDNANSGTITTWSEQLANFEIVLQEVDAGGEVIAVLMKYLPTGEIFRALWNGDVNGDCFGTCIISDGILHADAVTFSDDWEASYPYADLGDPVINNSGGLVSQSGLNTFRYGKKGIWRVKKSFVYQVERNQNGTVANNFNSTIDVDGEYSSWTPFSWLNGATNPNWDWTTEVTRYSPYGYVLEAKNRLSVDFTNNGENIEVYNSQIYGYDNSVVTATSANATYFEMGYSGFEQSSTYTYSGHIPLLGTTNVSTEKSHTGERSIKLLPNQQTSFEVKTFSSVTSNQYLMGKPGKDYIVSMWVNVEEANSNGTLTIGSSTIDITETGEVIDGWKKLELRFTMPPSDLTINYSSTGTTYIDDIRISPYNGGMVSYVYDIKNLWLVAELDALNYATFYNYDEEGQLVQVKKETEKGIVTVQTSRSNVKQAQ